MQYPIGGWREGDSLLEVFADMPDATAITEDAAYHYFAKREWSMSDIYPVTGGTHFAYMIHLRRPLGRGR